MARSRRTRWTRRQLLGGAAGMAALWTGACARPSGGRGRGGVWVNDIHSGLNRTRVHAIARPRSAGEVAELIRGARARGRAVCVAGGRHAMGGQQFGTDALLLDTADLRGADALDRQAGHVEVGAGTQWPELVTWLLDAQGGEPGAWGIRQKQTGADRLALGGALAANAHGRGLRMPPFVADVDAFTLVDAEGAVHRCSRDSDPERFALVCGGYGLFGVVTSLRLRLSRRRKLVRVVERVDLDELPGRFAERLAQGYVFGDCQYSTDLAGPTGLRRGLLACYRPVGDDTPIPERQAQLGHEAWMRLIHLAHSDRARAFEEYAAYYEGTSGQVYWSDTHQLSTYIDDYHAALARELPQQSRGSEMISEIYVPRAALPRFLTQVRRDLRAADAPLIYGTIRLIERDTTSFLAWAREPWACVIFNLHVDPGDAGRTRAARQFRGLIDRGLEHGGSYFLTYHRWATREQLLTAYPQFPEFLAAKRRLDPAGVFQSDWYRSARALLA